MTTATQELCDKYNKRLFTEGILPNADESCSNVNAILLAAGPLTKQPNTVAYRVVLRYKNSEYVVHHQYFPDWPNHLTCSYFESGLYSDDLEEAMGLFAERICDHATYTDCLLRK